MTKEEKEKKIEEWKKSAKKKYGGDIVSNSDKEDVYDIIPTGSIDLDEKTGIGGYPIGRGVEIFGQESSGKSTLTLHAIAECQKQGGVAGYIDVEQTFDASYAANIGVNVNDLVVSQPNSAEQSLSLAIDMIESGVFRLIVIDSLAQLVPQREIDGEVGDSSMGVNARLIGQFLRKAGPLLRKHEVCLIMLNQIREKLGVMFGSPETTPGGNGPKFFCSMRIRLSRTNNKEGSEVVSNSVKAKIIKNKCAPPFTEAQFDILFGVGIDKQKEVLDKAVEYGVIEKGGAWFTYGEHKIQGENKMKELMRDNPEFTEEIDRKVKEYLGKV